jgi:DNA-binding Xre family transcriptional regulator
MDVAFNSILKEGARMRLNRFRVREYMAKRRIARQKDLAASIGVTAQALSGWMNGEPFTLDNLGALCRELGCTPNDILELPNRVGLDPGVTVNRMVLAGA